MARRRRGRPIDGVLLLDKSEGVTSNRALQQVRGLYQAQKAGHTGTLDPMATGLLPICLGEATKFSSWLLDADKRYLADVRLGAVTDTGDREGEVLKEYAVPSLDDGDVEAVLSGFIGEIDQVPPMYSALKHQGRPLYEHARAGREIARAPRRVSIYDIALTSRHAHGFALDVSVSKGTYIRTLAEDIGERLGCGAHLEGLRRLRTGPFDDTDMLDIDTLGSMSDEQRLERLLPIDALIGHLPALETDAEGARRIMHGQPISLETSGLAEGDVARLYHDRGLLGVVTIGTPGQCAPRRLINTAGENR
ncbi:tRNA pseudouridine(55) synthase TruB [Kushneria indalinina]|uniref:tRNA pseudouridine synthase B n=1 Tax=Kushneria indalinina DSM 14324 TaxID=1122140 RepID=A0A3D9DRS1_9GAMM|nr:tRNA pseudouridine(55) synthase TruB [Kushneria indalinina]REC93463.1 tRNA pseudouridine synthase B [Kushneria indalinina DSM 14324]